jgi:hypothetical protein
MEKKEFSTVHLNHLSNENAASLFVQTCEHAIPVADIIGEMGSKALTNLQSSSASFSAQANRPQKSKYTEQVVADRKVSSGILAEIKRKVAFELKSRDERRKQAAKDFEFFFEPYSDIARAAIGTQIEQTQEMIIKYHSKQDIINAALTIGVDTLMTELETDNMSLSAIYKTRTIDMGNHEISSTDLRPAATDSYIQFSTIIEQAVNLMPNDALFSLFNTMDELRKKHNALISKPKDKETAQNA